MARKSNLLLRILAIGLFVFLLLSIRLFERQMFYDPLLDYFRSDYLVGALPKYDIGKLFFGLAFRYFLNTILSLGIIYAFFEDVDLLKFTAVLYVALFAILMLSFSALLYFESQNTFLIFYTRRFLIQPLFLLLFVPAVFYQKRFAKK